MRPCLRCGQTVSEVVDRCPACGAVVPIRFRKFGPWRVLDELAEGPRTLTFRARHEETAQDAVLTVFKSEEPLSREDVARLKEEARELSVLDHPHVPRTLTFDESATGVWYRVREWHDARGLKDVESSGELREPGNALRLFRAMAAALRSMASAGLHQPYLVADDVLVSGGPGDYFVRFNYRTFRYLDRQKDPPGSALARLLALHPDLQPGGAIASPRTDLFSLGVIFWDLLAGRPLASLDETSLLPGDRPIPESLRFVVRRLLERERHDRYRDPGELVEALEAVSERDVTESVKAADTAKRRVTGHGIRWRFRLAIGLAMAALAAVIAVVAWQQSRPDWPAIAEANRGAVYALVDGQGNAFCTAFAVDERGILATNAHCLAGLAEHRLFDRNHPDGLRNLLSIQAAFQQKYGREPQTADDERLFLRNIHAFVQGRIGRRFDPAALFDMPVFARRTGTAGKAFAVREVVLHPDYDYANALDDGLRGGQQGLSQIDPSRLDVADLALLHLELPSRERLPQVVRLASAGQVEALREGVGLMAMGFPYGRTGGELVSPTAPFGTVTNADCLRRHGKEPVPCRLHFLHQLNSSPGTSGSPFFTQDGFVVGVVIGSLRQPGEGLLDPGEDVETFRWAVRADLLKPMLDGELRGR